MNTPITVNGENKLLLKCRNSSARPSWPCPKPTGPVGSVRFGVSGVACGTEAVKKKVIFTADAETRRKALLFSDLSASASLR
jgi:hypothetical protein